MNLSEFADSALGAESAPFLPDAGPASGSLMGIVQHETLTHPLIASLFWQVFTRLEGYSAVLREVGLHGDGKGREELVVRHGTESGYWARYDLLVLDPEYPGADPTAMQVQVNPKTFAEAGAAYWSEHTAEGGASPWWFRLAGPDLVGASVAEASQAQSFGVIVARPPETLQTAIAPTPAWEVTAGPGEGSSCSVGVFASNREGRWGVTTAEHALPRNTEQVHVEGHAANVLYRDPVSDSCFIEVQDRTVVPSGRQISGPLRGVSPREGESVTFHGATSGDQSTIVTAWDKGIPFEIHPWNRLRVLTGAVTSRGDSGAALLDASDQAIGFAFDRTGYDAQIEYSAWIWAEFVFLAHGLH